MRSAESRASRTVERLERVLDALAVAAMYAIMVILFGDAMGRYVFRAPIPWAQDVESRVLLPAVFFFGLASALRSNQHVSIDMLYLRLGPRWRNAATALASLLAIVLFGIIAVLGASNAIDALTAGERMSGAIEWPVWVYLAFVPLGTALLVTRLALRMSASIRRGLRGEDALDLSPHGDDGPAVSP